MRMISKHIGAIENVATNYRLSILAFFLQFNDNWYCFMSISSDSICYSCSTAILDFWFLKCWNISIIIQNNLHQQHETTSCKDDEKIISEISCLK